MRKDGTYVRKERLSQISRHLETELKNGKKLSQKKALVWIQMNVGLTERKAGEYLSLICKAQDWKHVLENGVWMVTK